MVYCLNMVKIFILLFSFSFIAAANAFTIKTPYSESIECTKNNDSSCPINSCETLNVKTASGVVKSSESYYVDTGIAGMEHLHFDAFFNSYSLGFRFSYGETQDRIHQSSSLTRSNMSYVYFKERSLLKKVTESLERKCKNNADKFLLKKINNYLKLANSEVFYRQLKSRKSLFNKQGTYFSAKQAQINFGKKPIQAPEVLLESEVNELYNQLLLIPGIDFSNIEGNCNVRSSVMSSYLSQKGIRSIQIAFHADMSYRPGYTWGYHVAPMVTILKDGLLVDYVIDPSLFNEPVRKEVWMNKLESYLMNSYSPRLILYEPGVDVGAINKHITR